MNFSFQTRFKFDVFSPEQTMISLILRSYNHTEIRERARARGPERETGREREGVRLRVRRKFGSDFKFKFKFEKWLERPLTFEGFA